MTKAYGDRYSTGTALESEAAKAGIDMNKFYNDLISGREVDYEKMITEANLQGEKTQLAGDKPGLLEKLTDNIGLNIGLGGAVKAGVSGAGKLLAPATAALGAGTATSAGVGTLTAAGQVVPGIGEVASFSPGVGLSPGAAALAIPAAGIGAAMLSKKAENVVGEKAGSTAGKLAGVVANPIGAQINAAKDIVSKVFGGGKSHTDTKGSMGWTVGLTADEMAVQLGNPGKGISFDSNNPGSAVNNYNGIINSFTPAQLVARYASFGTKAPGTALDAKYKKIYDEGTAQKGSPLTPEEFAYLKDQGVMTA
jgi:hypothetical protein